MLRLSALNTIALDLEVEHEAMLARKKQLNTSTARVFVTKSHSIHTTLQSHLVAQLLVAIGFTQTGEIFTKPSKKGPPLNLKIMPFMICLAK